MPHMPATESTLVRAFTKRRPSNVVAPPPAPLPTQEAFQRRQAALRQMGLVPALSLSQQEAQLDRFLPPTSPVDHNSAADRIKNEWVAKNSDELVSFKFGGSSLPPSPPLTPLLDTFAGAGVTTPKPEADPAIEPTVIEPLSITTAPLTPQSDSPSLPVSPSDPIPPVNLLLNPSPAELSHSPISDDFHPPDSPAHFHPLRSRSPSLAPSDTKSTRSRSKSRTREKSPLRFFTQPEVPKPDPPQRKKTVFARFRRANTVDPSSISSPQSRQPNPQSPSRSKSLFTSVKKTVFGLTAANGGPSNNPSDAAATSSEEIPASVDANPSLPSLPIPSPNLTLVFDESTTIITTATAPAKDSDSLQPNPDGDVVVVVQDNPGVLGDEPGLSFGSSAEVRPDALLLGKVDFPCDRRESESQSVHDPDRERDRSTKGIGKGIGIGISLILNRERTKSASPSSSTPPASPLSSSFLSSSCSSPPASPTFSTGGGLLRGRLGRKGTIATGTLSVWGGVAGLLAGGAPSVNGVEMEERQAVAPTIHNQASILHHMSNIQDEETRRVTELAFM